MKKCGQCGCKPQLDFSINRKTSKLDLCNLCEKRNEEIFYNKNIVNFKWLEFLGNDRINHYNCVDSHLIFALQKLRTKTGLPFIITASIAVDGHAEDSYHYPGMAADGYFVGNKVSYIELTKEVFGYWKMIGGFGAYPYSKFKIFHLDIGKTRNWFQNEQGIYEPLMELIG